MKIHPRHFGCAKAYAEANVRVSHLAKTYDDVIGALIPDGVLHADSDPERVVAIREAILDVCETAECGPLTPGERMMLIGDVLCSSAKYLVRVERHGDESKEGGLE